MGFMGLLDLKVLSSICEGFIQINRSLFSKQIHFTSQDLCCLLTIQLLQLSVDVKALSESYGASCHGVGKHEFIPGRKGGKAG